MSNFVLKKIEAIIGKQDFFTLFISGKSQFEDYCCEIERLQQYKSELLTIHTLMQLVSNLMTLPNTKFKDITPTNDDVKEYEFKSRHLRVYAFHLERTGKIVVYGGYKNSQKEDIVKFRSLKRKYLNNVENDHKERINK